MSMKMPAKKKKVRTSPFLIQKIEFPSWLLTLIRRNTTNLPAPYVEVEIAKIVL